MEEKGFTAMKLQIYRCFYELTQYCIYVYGVIESNFNNMFYNIRIMKVFFCFFNMVLIIVTFHI